MRECDLLIENGRIARIDGDLSGLATHAVHDLCGHLLLPGMIDDQVHFREPGMTHKGDILSESRAAVAGGTTSFMEMPNTSPPTVNRESLADKFDRAKGRALANYSFYLGATNTNAETIAALEPDACAGVKVFMGSSTGNLLVEDERALERIFSVARVPVAVHCERNAIIAANRERLLAERDSLTAADHPLVRDTEACYASSSLAVELAQRHGTRLHILHLTTERELELLVAGSVEDKRITAEVCVHHLFFCDADYPRLGNRLVCNPAVKSTADRAALRRALVDDRLDIIATDHAPHTEAEKALPYGRAPAGLPLSQHALLVLLALESERVLSLEQIVHKACHAPALGFGVAERGFVREGYWADLVEVDPQGGTDGGGNLQSRAGWSPFADHRFAAHVESTWVNGVLVWDGERVCAEATGASLAFTRPS